MSKSPEINPCPDALPPVPFFAEASAAQAVQSCAAAPSRTVSGQRCPEVTRAKAVGAAACYVECGRGRFTASFLPKFALGISLYCNTPLWGIPKSQMATCQAANGKAPICCLQSRDCKHSPLRTTRSKACSKYQVR